MSMPLSDWQKLEKQLEAIVAHSGSAFDPATVAHARQVLSLARDTSTPPEIAKGYWSTVCFYWTGLEFEVFGDHIEVYRFSSDGRIDIEHHAHMPGEPFSSEVIAALPCQRGGCDP